MWIGDPLHIVSCLMGSFPHPIICWQLDDEEIEEVSQNLRTFISVNFLNVLKFLSFSNK